MNFILNSLDYSKILDFLQYLVNRQGKMSDFLQLKVSHFPQISFCNIMKKPVLSLTNLLFFVIICLVLSQLRPHRLSVRTLGFHPKKRGSTPLGATLKKNEAFSGLVFCTYGDGWNF